MKEEFGEHELRTSLDVRCPSLRTQSNKQSVKCDREVGGKTKTTLGLILRTALRLEDDGACHHAEEKMMMMMNDGVKTNSSELPLWKRTYI